MYMYKYIFFFWKEPDDATLAYIRSFAIERIDKICQTSTRRFFFFFFFFCIQKISFRNIGTVKGFIRDLQYGVYSKVKLINFVSRRIFNFPAEIQFRYSIAVNNNNNNDSEIINSSGHRLIDLAARLL